MQSKHGIRCGYSRLLCFAILDRRGLLNACDRPYSLLLLQPLALSILVCLEPWPCLDARLLELSPPPPPPELDSRVSERKATGWLRILLFG